MNPNPALLIIDVQKAIDDPSWGDDRNNPNAESNIAKLLALWRERSWPIFHIRHVSRESNSTYRPGQSGAEFKDEVLPRAGERIIEKQTNSAFIGTSLEAELRVVRLSQARNKIHVDDSRLARCKAAVAEMRNRLTAEKYTSDLANQFNDLAIPSEKKAQPTSQIIHEIRAHFGDSVTEPTTSVADKQ